ncbi:hypothetical protein [Streptomyces sp. NPDC056492]|uniref:hypothetical protein n=1 Tax=unclassified Streptomyces TaxID=2593676 RepID=UPI0036C64AD0
MDAALAGLVGALAGAILGTGGTLTATLLTTRAQAHAQYAQFSRDGRRGAYSAFLGAGTAFRTAAQKWEELAFATSPDEPAIAAALASAEGLRPDVVRAAQVVAVEGPDGVTESAFRFVDQTMEFVNAAGSSLRERDLNWPAGRQRTDMMSAHMTAVDMAGRLYDFAGAAREALHGPTRPSQTQRRPGLPIVT